MEESMNLLEGIKEEFDLGEVDLGTYSPLTFAFIGDCIFDLVIRTIVVERHNASPNRLHQEKSKLVKARTQAEMAMILTALPDAGRRGDLQAGKERKVLHDGQERLCDGLQKSHWPGSPVRLSVSERKI